MTNERQIYYRRKDDRIKKTKSIVIEGKQDGESILIWTLPSDPLSLLEFLIKASYFTQEKAEKINEKVKRLDIRAEKAQTDTPKVRTRIIKRTEENDARITMISEEDKLKLFEMTK